MLSEKKMISVEKKRATWSDPKVNLQVSRIIHLKKKGLIILLLKVRN